MTIVSTGRTVELKSWKNHIVSVFQREMHLKKRLDMHHLCKLSALHLQRMIRAAMVCTLAFNMDASCEWTQTEI